MDVDLLCHLTQSTAAAVRPSGADRRELVRIVRHFSVDNISHPLHKQVLLQCTVGPQTKHE